MRLKIILILLTMVGCNKLAEDTVTKGKGEYKVDKLFTIDGCTVMTILCYLSLAAMAFTILWATRNYFRK